MGNRLIIWELALVVVAVVGFAVWQLVGLRRDGEALRRQREAQARNAAAKPAPEDGGEAR